MCLTSQLEHNRPSVPKQNRAVTKTPPPKQKHSFCLGGPGFSLRNQLWSTQSLAHLPLWTRVEITERKLA